MFTQNQASCLKLTNLTNRTNYNYAEILVKLPKLCSLHFTLAQSDVIMDFVIWPAKIWYNVTIRIELVVSTTSRPTALFLILNSRYQIPHCCQPTLCINFQLKYCEIWLFILSAEIECQQCGTKRIRPLLAFQICNMGNSNCCLRASLYETWKAFKLKVDQRLFVMSFI